MFGKKKRQREIEWGLELLDHHTKGADEAKQRGDREAEHLHRSQAEAAARDLAKLSKRK